MRTHIYEPPLSMADDPRLVEVFLPLRKRLWWERVNWTAVGSFAVAMLISSALWAGIVYVFLWMVKAL